MPVYFAYGSNMDIDAMARRCPRSVPLGVARLVGSAFFISGDGYASVRPRAGATVLGLAWSLSLRDGAALDRYEELATGLYRKSLLPIRLGMRSCLALIYIGRSQVPGEPVKGYLASVVQAAEKLRLPTSYIDTLRSWDPEARERGPVSAVGRAPGHRAELTERSGHLRTRGPALIT